MILYFSIACESFIVSRIGVSAVTTDARTAGVLYKKLYWLSTASHAISSVLRFSRT